MTKKYDRHIKHLINNKSLAYNLSLNGRKKAENFSWPIVSNSWLSVLNSSK